MPSRNQMSQSKRGIDWRGIITILVVQVAVLLALSGAAIFYLNWSSDAAQAEFMATFKPSASEPSHPRQPPTPIQPVNGRTACTRRV